jgi:hypothetical protein
MKRRVAAGSLRWLVCLLTLLAPSMSRAHPLHTSLTRISVSNDGSLKVIIRAFSDDFSAAVARSARTVATPDYRVSDAAAARYLNDALAVAIDGHRVELSLESQRRDGDVTWIELRSARRVTLVGATILNRLLMDFHKDQVNIVQTTDGRESRTMLFSARDTSKSLW